MTSKAIITRRGAPRSDATAAIENTEAEDRGLTVEQNLAQGTLVSGDEKQFAALEEQGFRVKLLPDTNILEVGSYRIDIEKAAPRGPANLQVPKKLEKTWPHHLVQLIAPPSEDWIRTIEEQGVDVVEPISAYGLFVVGSPEQVNHLKNLPFVAWVGPFKPSYRIAPNLRKRKGKIQSVNVGVYPSAAVDTVREAIEKSGGMVVSQEAQSSSYGDSYGVLLVEIDADKLPAIATLPATRWIEYQGPDVLFDERSCQIVAENLDGAAAPNTSPLVGYQAAVPAGLGLTGAGVIIGIIDSGIDTHNNGTMHPDLAGRMAFFVDASGGVTVIDTNGHGTHVAGIAVGNATTGDTDPQGFLLGQGIAPGSQFGSVNPIGTGGPFMTDDNRVQNVVNNNGRVMNNSWGVTGGAGSGYTARSRTYDQRVRDPNAGAAGLEHLVIVSAAGNDGPGVSTIGAPWEAKNLIIVGNSMNFRPGEGDVDDIRGIRSSSSRGPGVDGRILPNIVAPGTDIISARSTVDADPGTPGIQRPRTAYTDTGATVHNNHTRLSGTSMAAPHVSGLCALLIEWWRGRANGKNPSPALLKALLINGAEDLAGGPDGAGGNLTNIPNNNQGWGRVSLENIVLQAPASDRGPKIFSDQRHAFIANGQEHMIRVAPVDAARPMRITLVWTDAAGAVNANPALVNDLDLEVTELATANIYRGNVFANGFSTTGGAFDTRNNIECVYLQNPAGTYEVRVLAANIAASAHPDITTAWQDFVLVIDNAEVPGAAPVSVVPVIDRSGSMVWYGYEAITRISSKQFVDLMGLGDGLGVVSFGDTGVVEYPTGASPVLQNITGQPIRDAAKAEIDGMAFGGCTYMGDGIIKARDLLNPAVGSRAMLLLSDGYDNKGCQAANPARPSALEAVASLPPATMPVYTCAMGPSSDQNLLEQIANATNGRYYYMPTIDDLFEIYNYIRGQVTGDAIIANESAMASSSSVAAFVDALATEATFSVAWGDTSLHFVPGDPKKSNEVNIRLRDPRGRLLHPDMSYVRRTVGAGYVLFELQEPTPGQWSVEVTTLENTHVRYTVGGFVRSPIRLTVSLLPKVAVAGMPLTIAAQIFDGQQPIKGFQADARVIAPTLGIPGLQAKYKAQLAKIRPVRTVGGDRLPREIGKLVALRNKFVKAGRPDIFATTTAAVSLKDVTVGNLTTLGLSHLLTPGAAPIGLGETPPALPLPPIVPSPSVNPLPPLTISGVLQGRFMNTEQHGSYNVMVTASGISPLSDTRFVRQELVSVLVR